MSANADMAELADAHGSGPCGGDSIQVQVLLSAPYKNREALSFPIFVFKEHGRT